MNTINDKIIQAATTGKRLSQASLQELHVPLTRCAAIMGAKEAIADTQFQMFQQVLALGYPHITVDELTIACTMNLAQQFEKPVNCYGEFTPKTICDILAQYKDVRGKVMVRYQSDTENRTLLPQNAPKEVTDEDWLKIIEADKEHLKANRDHWTLGAVRVMRWLQATGRVKDSDFTDEQINQMRARAKENVMKRESITNRKLSDMVPADRRAFDQKCINELQTIAYYQYLTR